MARIPASIRTKNPSAMWPGVISKKFGSTEHENLQDGQGNKIAIFPTVEQGGAAQFALWASKGYLGKTLADAIKKWSGGNSSPAYAKSLAQHVPGLSTDTVITKAFLQSENGWKFMKFQAQWEAGQPYPMTDAQWQTAQSLAFGDKEPAPTPAPIPAPKTTKPLTKSKTFWSSVTGTLATATGFLTDWKVIAAIVVLAAFGYIVWERNGKPDIRGWFR